MKLHEAEKKLRDIREAVEANMPREQLIKLAMEVSCNFQPFLLKVTNPPSRSKCPPA